MLAAVIDLALLGLAVSMAMCLYRLLIGPAVVDRVLALDTMSVNLIALIGVLSIRWRTDVYLEAMVVLALLSFVTTVAVAKYLLRGRIVE